ncbi:transposase [Klebsiella pneumoniae]|nr:transposase [Klebsiella pneumoniae]
MQHRIILPGATTLTRLISEVREKATLRLWNKLALIPSAEQRSQLEMLLGPTDCSRLSLLESLKKGPVTISGPAFNEAIERWKTLNDFGLHAENLSTLPAVRLKNLARYAGMTSVFNIARMSPQKRMAVLVAFVLAWETLALDDALDVLDAMLAVIIRDARKIGQKKRLRSLKDLDKSALALASACSYLLKEETPDESIRAEVFSYIPRQKGTVAKLAMRQPFVLFKGLTFQKLCLPGAFRPGDHHNKMLRPGLCVVHASPQYL